MLVAAGRGVRAGGDKLWADVAGKPLIALSIENLARAGRFERVVVVAPLERHPEINVLLAGAGMMSSACVSGGERRRDSVRAGLDAAGDCDIVCIHDAARPLCPPDVFGRVIDAAIKHGAATAAIPCTDTIKRVSGGLVLETLPRDSLVAVQTPQAFRPAVLRSAHESSDEDASDDCVLVERNGGVVAVVDGDPRNRKITLAADIDWLRAETEPS